MEVIFHRWKIREFSQRESALKIRELIWLEEIIEKLERKHHVRQEEVREVFANRPKFRFVEKGHYPGENVYAALGQTNAGRHLIVFFVCKQNRSALILSARNMTPTERKKYEQK
jgi:uncharacterized DUF497 family protein